MLKLLAIKDSDVRILTLEQCRDAVDKGLHAGGAFSAVIPLVALFYGGFMDIDIADPTRRGQDLFVLSKGHAVAALASIYAELGYFDRDVLRNSRSYESILNGHPGPILPGIHIATGPDGSRLRRGAGLRDRRPRPPRFDSYCMSGDGELQEGPIWEAVMFAGAKHLDNLACWWTRITASWISTAGWSFPCPTWRPSSGRSAGSVSVDATQYDGVYAALEEFRFGAQRQAHRDHLQHDQGLGRLLRFHEPAQSGGPGRADGAGIGAARPAAGARVAEFGRFYLAPGTGRRRRADAGTLANLARGCIWNWRRVRTK